MTMTPPGGMFIHRNIANLVNEGDLNLMSALQYPVNVLEVHDIILCGHHGCGGIQAALSGGTDGAVDEWLGTARAVYQAHSSEIVEAGDSHAQLNRFVELNVRDQLVRLARTQIIRDRWASGAPLALHGRIYDLRDGQIKPLLELGAHTELATVAASAGVL